MQTTEQPTTPKIELLPDFMIAPSPLNPRKRLCEESLTALANDIRLHGILQPITVRPARKGEITNKAYQERTYLIVLGERRWRAAGIAGIEDIPCIIREDLDDATHLRMAYSENAQRSDLTAVESAQAYEKMLALEPTLTQESLAKRLGVSQSRIANRLRLLKLPLKVRDMLEAGALTEAAALELCAISDHPSYIDTLAALSTEEGGWTQAKMAQEVRAFKAQQSAKPAAPALFEDGEASDALGHFVPMGETSECDPRSRAAGTGAQEPTGLVTPAVVAGEDGDDSPTPLPAPTVFYLKQADLREAFACYAAEKVASGNPKTRATLYRHGDTMYTILATESGPDEDCARGHSLVHREEWEVSGKPTLTWAEYCGQRTRREYAGGLLIHGHAADFVTTAEEVEFRGLLPERAENRPVTAYSGYLGDGVANLPPGQKSTWGQWCSNAGHDWRDRSDLPYAAYMAGWTGGEFAKGKRRKDGEWETLESLAIPAPPAPLIVSDEPRTLYLLENKLRGRWNACDEWGEFVEAGETRDALVESLTARGHECLIIESLTYDSIVAGNGKKRDLEAVWESEQKGVVHLATPTPTPKAVNVPAATALSPPHATAAEWDIPQSDAEWLFANFLHVPKAIAILRRNHAYLLSPFARRVADAIGERNQDDQPAGVMLENILLDYAESLGIDTDLLRDGEGHGKIDAL